jgi:vacuolar protein sorting-associated protein 13A/C
VSSVHRPELIGKQYKLTKVVTLCPRFIIRNTLNEAIRVRSFTSQEPVTIAAGERKPIFWLPASSELKMSFSFENSPWCGSLRLARAALKFVLRSPLFSMQDVGRVHLRTTHRERGVSLVTVDALLEGPTVFLRFALETGRWPFELRNDSDTTLTYWQGVSWPSTASRWR